VRGELASWLEGERRNTHGVGRISEVCEKGIWGVGGGGGVSLFVSFGPGLGRGNDEFL